MVWLKFKILFWYNVRIMFAKWITQWMVRRRMRTRSKFDFDENNAHAILTFCKIVTYGSDLIWCRIKNRDSKFVHACSSHCLWSFKVNVGIWPVGWKFEKFDFDERCIVNAVGSTWTNQCLHKQTHEHEDVWATHFTHTILYTTSTTTQLFCGEPICQLTFQTQTWNHTLRLNDDEFRF